MADNIKVVRFLTNDELIGTLVEETDTTITIKNPLRIVVMPSKTDPKNPQIGFVPWMEFSADKEFTISKSFVLVVANPIDEFITQYKSVFSGLVVPKAQIIMPS